MAGNDSNDRNAATNPSPNPTFLNPEQRRELAELYRAGTSADDLAQHYGISKWTVWRWAKATDTRREPDTVKGNAKTTIQQRDDIRRRVAAGEKRADLAREYGLSGAGIDWIVNHPPKPATPSPLLQLPQGFRPGQTEPIDGTNGARQEPAPVPAPVPPPVPVTTPVTTPTPAVAPAGTVTMRAWLLSSSNQPRCFLSANQQFLIQQLENTDGREPEFRVWFRDRERKRLRATGAVLVGILDWIGVAELDQSGTIFFPGRLVNPGTTGNAGNGGNGHV